jgi:hypothetical protein
MTDEELDRQEAVPVPPRLGELQELVDDLILAVEGARNVPLSSSVMLDRTQLLDMLYRLRDELPDELRAARWMVREREAFVARTNEKAVEEANALVRRAEAEATRTRLEAEDYSEQAYEQTEAVLADLLAQVRRARSDLHQARPGMDEGA